MSVIIIHRPSAATKAFARSIPNGTTDPYATIFCELADKDTLTEHEVKFMQHFMNEHGFELVQQ